MYEICEWNEWRSTVFRVYGASQAKCISLRMQEATYCDYFAKSVLHSSDVLERKPTEIDLADVAKISGGNWKRLLTYLGVPYDQTVTFLVKCNQNVHDACYEGLMYWHMGNAVVDEEPSPVTYTKLLKSMEDADMKSTAEEMRKKIVDQYKPVVNTLQPSPGGEYMHVH